MATALSDHAAGVPLKPGDRLGDKYKLERLLGQGAAGQVWLAVHETIGRSVAIKVLRNETKRSAAVRFLQEARIAACVQSRYVVSTFDFGNTPTGLLYMVMEHLHGETLGARLSHGPPLTVRELLRYVGQALIGLHEVHRAGIVHRDLKPENIFLVEEGDETFAKILDFGVSRPEEGGTLGQDLAKLTATGMTVGTPLYMAPEQARGKRHELDARTDLYAIGVIMYRAISSESPFADTSVVDLLMAAVAATVAPALVDVRSDVPEALSEVIQKAMAPKQYQRYNDADALRLALAELQMQIPETLTCVTATGAAASTEEYLPLTKLLPPTEPQPTLPGSLLSLPSLQVPRVAAATKIFAGLGVAALITVLVFAASGFWARKSRATSDVSTSATESISFSKAPPHTRSAAGDDRTQLPKLINHGDPAPSSSSQAAATAAAPRDETSATATPRKRRSGGFRKKPVVVIQKAPVGAPQVFTQPDF